MQINQIIAFLAVAELESFSLAAERLHITQPAVSKRIRQLENHIRVELFDEEVESLSYFDPLTGEVLRRVPRLTIYPKTHYVTPRETLLASVESIKSELKQRLQQLRDYPEERIFSSTGILTLNENNVITRTLMWAQFREGEVQAVPMIFETSMR